MKFKIADVDQKDEPTLEFSLVKDEDGEINLNVKTSEEEEFTICAINVEGELDLFDIEEVKGLSAEDGYIKVNKV